MFEADRDAIIADLRAGRRVPARNKMNDLLTKAQAAALLAVGPDRDRWDAAVAVLQHQLDAHVPAMLADVNGDAILQARVIEESLLLNMDII